MTDLPRPLRGELAAEWVPLGTRVVHSTFGPGEVVACEDDTITLLFDEAGYRNLSVELVRTGNLLKPA
jgi:ATP-dependent DNA helicase RecQ